MSLRSNPASRISVCLIACAAAVAAAQPVRADELLEYLDSHGLDALAALRVEELAAAASGDERAQLLDRLADIYARMLDTTADSAAQTRQLERADALAARIATAKGDGLRLAAARARYRSAARVAEAIRAGLPGDSNAAVEVLTQQIEVLVDVAARADKRANELDRRINSDKVLEAQSLQEQKSREESLAGISRYLAAWSLTYRGFLTGEHKDSDRAVGIFLPILGAREGKLEPSEVSEPLRADELYASAILGLALAKAPTGGYGESARWLALLDFGETAAAVREVRYGWSLIAALEARAFGPARELLAKVAPRDDAANWARIAVARSVELGAENADSVQLRREAIALLAAKRDLGAIRDLTRKFGDEILGDDATGFVPLYVRAVRLYDESQKAVEAAAGDAEKLDSDAVRVPANTAAEALAAALAAPDAKNFADAGTACKLMRAWSLRAAGDFAAAGALFDVVAAESVGDRAEEAARLSILSLDDARRRTTKAEERKQYDEQLVAKVDAFLARFPASDHVPELLVRKVASMSEPTGKDVRDLMRVPAESKDWLVARKQALEGSYRVFRNGKEPRADTGKQYLAILAELPVDPQTGLPASSTTIARQALEVALANEVRATQTAIGLIASLEKAAAAGKFDLREADEEMAYRRLQLAMLLDRWADVEAALAPFEKPEATKLWADAGLRLAIRGAEGKRRAVAADAAERGAYVATILRAGDAILARNGGAANALAAKTPDAAALAQIAAIVLDARAELVRANGNAEQAKRGLELVDVLLARKPNDGALLRSGAVFAESCGNYARAAELLRTLVGGLPQRTDAWFGAKVDQMRVLAKLDPARARQVLAQYRALYPDLGPEPFRTRIREIEATLPAEAPAAAQPAIPPSGKPATEGAAP